MPSGRWSFSADCISSFRLRHTAHRPATVSWNCRRALPRLMSLSGWSCLCAVPSFYRHDIQNPAVNFVIPTRQCRIDVGRRTRDTVSLRYCETAIALSRRPLCQFQTLNWVLPAPCYAVAPTVYAVVRRLSVCLSRSHIVLNVSSKFGHRR